MNCTETRDNLSALLDGELDRETAAQVQAHVAGCPACRAELESLRTLVGTLHAMPRHRAPEEIERTVVSQLERDSLLAKPAVPARRRFRTAAILSAAAAAVVLVGAGVYFARHTGQPARNLPETTTVAMADKHQEPPGGAAGYAYDKDAASRGGEMFRTKTAGPGVESPAAPAELSGGRLTKSGETDVSVATKPSNPEPAPLPATTPMPTKIGVATMGKDGPATETKAKSMEDLQVAAKPEVVELEFASADVAAARSRINTIANSLNIRAVDATALTIENRDADHDDATQPKDLPTRVEGATQRLQRQRAGNDDGRVREAAEKIARNSRTGDEYEETVKRMLDLADQVADEPSPPPVLVLAVPEEQLPDFVAKLHADQAANDKGQSVNGTLTPVGQNTRVQWANNDTRSQTQAPVDTNNNVTRPAAKPRAPDVLDDFLKALDEAAKEDAEREKMSQEPYGLEAIRGGQKHPQPKPQDLAKQQKKEQAKPDVAQAEDPKRNVPVAQHGVTMRQDGPILGESQRSPSARRMVYLQIYLTQSTPEAANAPRNAPSAPAK